jgi:hypothetical protein
MWTASSSQQGGFVEINSEEQSLRAKRNWHHLIYRIARVVRIRRRWGELSAYIRSDYVQNLCGHLESRRGKVLYKDKAAERRFAYQPPPRHNGKR